jgi:hypothetical protein
LVVAAGQGSVFPAVPFQATIWPTAALPLTTNAEIVTVTARSTDTLTIVRAQEGTAARTVVTGDQIAATITNQVLTDMDAPLAPTTDYQIRAGYSHVVPRKFTIASGKKMTIGNAAIMRIL